ncbi:hypothetical protein NDU88_002556 [Pleurodeles waltl]|uniref:Uncharacterized protein n=1 Tax=Pleurodeles waltl TaxID=8319 RepID=A0AAV7LPL0_PLEWA|nr:hypothetical protein NDU88_002556 [Pleurodeles waltl]
MGGRGQAVDNGGRELKKLRVAAGLSGAIWWGQRARDTLQVTGEEPERHRNILVLRAYLLERRAEELVRGHVGRRTVVLGRAEVRPFCVARCGRQRRDLCTGAASRQGSPTNAVAPVEVRIRQQVRRVGGLLVGASREQDKDPDWACRAPWGLAGVRSRLGRT